METHKTKIKEMSKDERKEYLKKLIKQWNINIEQNIAYEQDEELLIWQLKMIKSYIKIYQNILKMEGNKYSRLNTLCVLRE